MTQWYRLKFTLVMAGLRWANMLERCGNAERRVLGWSEHLFKWEQSNG